MNQIPLTAILVDDEKNAISNLSSLLTSYCPSINIIETADSAFEALTKINQIKPDVVFMDVNMPGMNGFDILDKLSHFPLVVFVTAHEKHALRAMKVCAVDFLLKPVDIKELVITETKLKQLQSVKTEIRESYKNVLRNFSELMADKSNKVSRIALPDKGGYEIIDLKDIIYISGEDNYSVFHFSNQKEKLISKTLKEYEEMLESLNFMRIHKSFLVNLKHITKVIKTDTTSVLLSNGVSLLASRRKSVDLMTWSKNRNYEV